MNASQRQQCIDIIDLVETKLLEQGSRSVQIDTNFYIGSQCALRGANGMKCAIGWLVPDDVYTPDLDKVEDPVLELIATGNYEKCFGEQFYEKTEILQELQYVHDHIGPSHWSKEFKRIRKEML
jgi:hypothetical protein